MEPREGSIYQPKFEAWLRSLGLPIDEDLKKLPRSWKVDYMAWSAANKDYADAE